MKDIVYLKGDATEPVGDGLKIIAHVCNNKGGWGKGFVKAISKKWKQPELDYRSCIKCGFNLEDTIISNTNNPNIKVANMIAQNGYVSQCNPTPLHYPSLMICLEKIVNYIDNVGESVTVHMPRIGCGLAGGSWDRVEEIIKTTLCSKDIQVYVYDLN